MLLIGFALLAIQTSWLVASASSAGADGPIDNGRVLLSVCPAKNCSGVHVYLDSASNHFGSDGYSYCTADETSTEFDVTKDGEAHTLHMIAKNGGTCYARNSYNTWIVAAYKDGHLLGHTLVWIGQDIPLGFNSYYAKCIGSDPWPASEPHLVCTKDTSYGASPLWLKISLPPPPGPPDCPSSGSSCYVEIHVDTPVCPTFKADTLTCKGSSKGTPGWVAQLGVTQFGWTTTDGRKKVTYSAAAGGAPFSSIQGQVPNAGSADLMVTEAYSTKGAYPASRWRTGSTGLAGRPNGPLYIDFHAGITGADIYMHGFLERIPPKS